MTMPYVPSDLVHLEDYKILDEEGQINWFLGVCPSAFGTEKVYWSQRELRKM